MQAAEVTFTLARFLVALTLFLKALERPQLVRNSFEPKARYVVEFANADLEFEVVFANLANGICKVEALVNQCARKAASAPRTALKSLFAAARSDLSADRASASSKPRIH